MKSKLVELLDLLSSFDEVKRYKRYQSLINEDSVIKQDLLELNKLKKEMTNTKYLNLVNAYSKAKEEYETILKRLDNNVLYSEYIESKSEVMEIIKLISSIIEEDLSDQINK